MHCCLLLFPALVRESAGCLKEDQWKPRDSHLKWSFTNGEIIQRGDNVFRETDEDEEELEDIKFSAVMNATGAQSVTLKYFAGWLGSFAALAGVRIGLGDAAFDGSSPFVWDGDRE